MEPTLRFDCQLYITKHDAMRVAMPVLTKPRQMARLEPISFEALIDPALGRLLVALDGLPATVSYR